MAVFLGAFPVLPGKEDDARRFAKETMARDEFDTSLRGRGITKEEWSLQQTPMGSLVVVRFEASDVGSVFGELAASTDDFDVWFRQNVLDVTGVDLSGPLGPPPEILVDWSA